MTRHGTRLGLALLLAGAARPAVGQPGLDLSIAKVAASLPYAVTIGGEERKGALEPGAGKVFVAVKVVFRDSGELARVRVDRTILKDAAGQSATPVGFAPIKLESLIPFAEVTQFYGGLFSTGSPEAGSAYMISQMRGPTEYLRSGKAGTSFFLVFPVAEGQTQFTLTIAGPPAVELVLQ